MEYTPMKTRLGILATVTILATTILDVLFDTTVYLWLICASVVFAIAWIDWIFENRTTKHS